MSLSAYVPQIIASHLPHLLQPIFEEVDPNDLNHWIIHPGGKKILDLIASAYGLHESRLQASYSTLADYGSMSSPTLLFVLQKILKDRSNSQPEKALAMAFGPGLCVETATFNLMTPIHD